MEWEWGDSFFFVRKRKVEKHRATRYKTDWKKSKRMQKRERVSTQS